MSYTENVKSGHTGKLVEHKKPSHSGLHGFRDGKKYVAASRVMQDYGNGERQNSKCFESYSSEIQQWGKLGRETESLLSAHKQ